MFGFERRVTPECHAAMPEVHHETAYFTGRVQGVGFRYQTLQIAKGFEVCGFVRNLPDGRVQVEAEGGQREVSAFIAAIEEHMESYIRETARSHTRRAPVFRGFEIR